MTILVLILEMLMFASLRQSVDLGGGGRGGGGWVRRDEHLEKVGLHPNFILTLQPGTTNCLCLHTEIFFVFQLTVKLTMPD
jgi:hypothetical protein